MNLYVAPDTRLELRGRSGVRGARIVFSRTSHSVLLLTLSVQLLARAAQPDRAGYLQAGAPMEDEKPDWNFWSFVVALIQLALELAS